MSAVSGRRGHGKMMPASSERVHRSEKEPLKNVRGCASPCFCKTRLERPMRRGNGPITDAARPLRTGRLRTGSRLPVVFRPDIMLRPETQAFGKSILPLSAPPGSRKDDRQKTSVEKFLSKFFSGAELLNAEGPRERRGP